MAPAQRQEVLERLREYFRYVMVDTASVLRDMELSSLHVSDRIVLLATPDIPA